MISVKQLADFGYKTFSRTMILLTGCGICFMGYQGYQTTMLTSEIKKRHEQNSSNSRSP